MWCRTHSDRGLPAPRCGAARIRACVSSGTPPLVVAPVDTYTHQYEDTYIVVSSASSSYQISSLYQFRLRPRPSGSSSSLYQFHLGPRPSASSSSSSTSFFWVLVLPDMCPCTMLYTDMCPCTMLYTDIDSTCCGTQLRDSTSADRRIWSHFARMWL